MVLLVISLLILVSSLSIHVKTQTTGYTAPVGINISGGGTLANGSSVTYTFATNGLKGVFIFYGGNFYSGSPANSNSFSVQLNGNMYLSNFQIYFVKDLAIVTYNSTSGKYRITFEDEVWNATTKGASLSINSVTGNGGPTSYEGITYYQYQAYFEPLTSTPFNITLWYYTTLTPQGYPQIQFYYQFSNSTYTSPAIKFDTVTIEVSSSSAYITIGGPVIPLVAQFIVGGAYHGAVLYVYSWKATMLMFYLYNGKWYVPPSAYSLPPKTYLGLVSNETVSQTDGIIERWVNTNSSVIQLAGENVQTPLWTIYENVKLIGTSLIFSVIPNGARWVGEITEQGTTTTFNVTNGTSITVSPGTVNYELELYAGTLLVFSTSGTLEVVGDPVTVSSPVPFTVNGVTYQPGNYTFKAPVTISFNPIYYVNSQERYVLKYILYDGTPTMQTTFTINIGPVYLTAYYYQQFYVTFPFTVMGYVNGLEQTLSSGWYNASSNIYIPSQTISINATTRYITSPVNIIVTSPMSVTIPYSVQYYVSVTQPIPALINGANITLNSGWFNKSTLILIYKIYYINSSSRELISASQYLIVVNQPLTIYTRIVGYQDYFGIYWPNSIITYNWYNLSSKILLPTYVYINSTARYILISNSTVTVIEPTIIIPRYEIQYYAVVKYPNGTEIKGWYNLGSVITVP